MSIFVLFSLPILIMSAVIHEYAHGWVAYKLGDPTAKYAGRLTLNPLPHVDPMGTIFLPLMLVFLSSLPGARPIILAWAKPVPINPSLLRHPKQDMFWVSIAGITSNILLALIFSFLLRMRVFPINSFGWLFLNIGILINVLLAVFNAIPIPPLDGSKILMRFLPPALAYSYMRLEQFGFLILLGLIYLGFFNIFVWPVIAIIARIFGAQIL